MYPESENDRTLRYMLLTKDLKICPGFEVPMAVLERTHAEKTAKMESRQRRAHGSCGFVDGMITPPDSQTNDQEQDQPLQKDGEQQGNTDMESNEDQVQHDEMEGTNAAEIDKNGNKQQNEIAEMATQVEVIDIEEQETAKMDGKDGDVPQVEEKENAENGLCQENEKAEEKADGQKDPPKNTKKKHEEKAEGKDGKKEKSKMEKDDTVEETKKNQKAKNDAMQKAKKKAKNDAMQKAKKKALQKAKKDAKQKLKKDAKKKAKKAKQDAKKQERKDAKQDDVKIQEKRRAAVTRTPSKPKKETEDQIKKKLHSVPWLSYVRLE